ncbi:MAG: SusD/RagB family nutrient-binding outer membrane lipoprotein [Saprospiraceae bacterium]|nr:SusD/RagB family nutrient-binding outer membrane lipoprotein [Saprospiraceae bacterium]
MKQLKYSILAFFILATAACTEDFQEINTNPNAPVDVQPGLLLRNVIFDYGEQMSYEGFVAGNLLGQMFTAIDFNLFDRHSLTEPQLGGNPWDILYVNLRDNEIILDKSRENAAFAVYEGPALVLKAYMTAALTDIYGDVPYSEALNGKEGNTTPVFDAQEDIYLSENGILDNLDKAIIAMKNYQGVTPLEGDLFYQGNLENWVKLANSLKIKALMRISAQQDVATELQAIYDSGEFIQSATDNAVFDFSASPPNNFRISTLRVGDFNLFIMSETIQEILTELEDPRQEVFFRPATSAEFAGQYRGLLNGPDASQLSISVADYSLTGAVFRENAGALDANFMTSWEVHFLLAEAAEKGLISADAKALYETGVAQAFDYWNTALPANYLTEGAAAYKLNGADPIEQIITQKWLASLVNGYEGWIEFRRTGFPQLKTISASLNNDLIPVRMPYPTSEDALNNANFMQAAAATDGNSVNAKVWWDVN